MKIALSGAQSVGKSTVLKEIEDKNLLPGFVLVKEVVRALVAKGITINKGADHRSQVIILEEHYKNVLRYNNVLTDRCSLDAFVYATWDYLNGSFTYKEHKEHEALFLDCIQSYDVIFYIAPEFEIVDDGFRSIDATYQQEIHQLFLKLSDKYKKVLPPILLLKGTVEERINAFESCMKSLTK